MAERASTGRVCAGGASFRCADTSADVLAARLDPFFVIGSVSIVAGGLVAAVTAPLHLAHGSWSAAFLVLIGGVAQIALGKAQAALALPEPPVRVLVTELVTWNLGVAAVITGTLVRVPVIVDAGGVLLVGALGTMIFVVRGRSESEGATAPPRWARCTYRALLGVVLASIPVGLTLAHLRSS